jgi:exopolysaccharide biosynthesis polyprenyl glycosylphosphotransferase
LSERKLLLLVTDLILLNMALCVSLIYRGSLAPDLAALWQRGYWFLSLSVLWAVVAVFLDVYDLPRAASPMRSVWGTGSAALVTVFIYLLIPIITPKLPESRMMILLFPFLALIGLSLWRIAYAIVFVQPVFQRRALILGAGPSGRALARVILGLTGDESTSNSSTGYYLMGFVDHRDKLRGTEIEGLPVLGVGKELVDIVRQLVPNEIILAYRPSDNLPDELFEAIVECGETGIPLVNSSAVYEELTRRVPLRHVGRNLSIVFPLEEPLQLRLYDLFRRVFDILVGAAGFGILLLLIPFVWLGNRLSPGPLFYRQERVGKSGKIFRIIKFRSMINDAEKDTGAVWASREDDRVTFMGRFLRRSRLDELPQCWNILKGEMSLIGPRPERPQFVEELSRRIPFYRIRHAVKPGITGWAQVRYSYGASVEDAIKKLQYDLYYVKHRGPYLDCLILLHTVKVILRFDGV